MKKKIQKNHTIAQKISYLSQSSPQVIRIKCTSFLKFSKIYKNFRKIQKFHKPSYTFQIDSQGVFRPKPSQNWRQPTIQMVGCTMTLFSLKVSRTRKYNWLKTFGHPPNRLPRCFLAKTQLELTLIGSLDDENGREGGGYVI